MSNKTIVATCYAVNPYKGSEDGMGWNFVYQIARFNKVYAITRENNQESIEKYMSQNPDSVYSNITFLYFDLPYWMRFWKKGGHGDMLYYYMWQIGIVRFIKNKNIQFDIAHNVNFHNDWTPSFLYKLGKPMVWGPVGHHPIIPEQYLKFASVASKFKNSLAWLVKKFLWKWSPSLNKTIKKANHIWCMNKGVPSVLKLKNENFSIFPSVASEDFYIDAIPKKENFHIISVGRFVTLKGFDLALHSFSAFINSLTISERKICKLTLVGSGPEKKLYKKIIIQNNIQAYVEIIEWIDRSELMKLYEKSAVFLFPSHEGAGMAVAEALSFGLPIICLENEGSGQYIDSSCGFAIPESDYLETVMDLKKAIQKLYSNQDLLHQMSTNARKKYKKRFTWNSRGEHLKTIYNQL
ncbi:glycosyltransferase involved in cell wall biosynthesis [Flavobacterium sp. 1]|uniref:glycosyltransferase family 4 protein n=1 Tax=Flavobacterium sp. 1 TaxID=2035200 RepID=UPI000C23618D|nr:glycosyltransferase [Flavobacterium sp. 1]PJJ08301.1 glycosyltransferase involved in cell wall biosynthesis [Flavobacterium sp. 1]